MELTARSLTNLGLERFRACLARLRKGERIEPPWELLEGRGYTSELPFELELAQQAFVSRIALAKHLAGRLKYPDAGEIDRNRGLWGWLSLFYFDQVCPLRSDGTRRPGQDYRHIPEPGYRHRLRHLLYGPYRVYRRPGAPSKLLLSGPVHSESGIYHEIASRQDLIANTGVVEAAMLLYYDVSRGGPKPGAQDTKARPGTVRRFVRVLQQLDLTYDIYGLSGEQILELLPAEFDAWQPDARQAELTLAERG